jgi:hypothetical protein
MGRKIGREIPRLEVIFAATEGNRKEEILLTINEMKELLQSISNSPNSELASSALREQKRILTGEVELEIKVDDFGVNFPKSPMSMAGFKVIKKKYDGFHSREFIGLLVSKLGCEFSGYDAYTFYLEYLNFIERLSCRPELKSRLKLRNILHSKFNLNPISDFSDSTLKKVLVSEGRLTKRQALNFIKTKDKYFTSKNLDPKGVLHILEEEGEVATIA